MSKSFQDRRKVRSVDFFGSFFNAAQCQHRESDLVLTVRGKAPPGFKGFFEKLCHTHKMGASQRKKKTASVGGAAAQCRDRLLPMLSLGIPGSATAAVMMSGQMIWGLNPGPALFVERKDFVWGLIASMYLGNIVAVIPVLLTVPRRNCFVAISRASKSLTLSYALRYGNWARRPSRFLQEMGLAAQ